MRAFQFQAPNNGPWLVRTFEMVRTTSEDKAEQLFEVIKTIKPLWAKSVDLNEDIISASFTYEGHERTVEVPVSVDSKAQDVLDLLEAEYLDEIEQIERLNQEWEHPRHTQGY